jgi:hypothetical protein
VEEIFQLGRQPLKKCSAQQWSSNNKGKIKAVLYLKETGQEVTSYVQGKAQW